MHRRHRVSRICIVTLLHPPSPWNQLRILEMMAEQANVEAEETQKARAIQKLKENPGIPIGLSMLHSSEKDRSLKLYETSLRIRCDMRRTWNGVQAYATT